MNTIKSLTVLLIAYGVQAADSQDIKRVIDILKEKGKTTYINQEKTYYLDTNPSNYAVSNSTLRYHEFFNGKEALSYEYKESIADTIRTTAIYDYLGGKIDGTPDIYIITKMNRAEQKINSNKNFNPISYANVGKIDSTQNARYNEAIEEIITLN